VVEPAQPSHWRPTTVAHADTFAPYARAAAYVSGTLKHGKNIVSVSNPSTGVYCVKVSNKIDLSNAVASATGVYDRRMVTVLLLPSSDCGNAANTARVLVFDGNGNKTNGTFMLFIP
jgi:hypothetical protein